MRFHRARSAFQQLKHLCSPVIGAVVAAPALAHTEHSQVGGLEDEIGATRCRYDVINNELCCAVTPFRERGLCAEAFG
jgi:hypothetical protein